jgi:hypothetical protein
MRHLRTSPLSGQASTSSLLPPDTLCLPLRGSVHVLLSPIRNASQWSLLLLADADCAAQLSAKPVGTLPASSSLTTRLRPPPSRGQRFLASCLSNRACCEDIWRVGLRRRLSIHKKAPACGRGLRCGRPPGRWRETGGAGSDLAAVELDHQQFVDLKSYPFALAFTHHLGGELGLVEFEVGGDVGLRPASCCTCARARRPHRRPGTGSWGCRPPGHSP